MERNGNKIYKVTLKDGSTFYVKESTAEFITDFYRTHLSGEIQFEPLSGGIAVIYSNEFRSCVPLDQKSYIESINKDGVITFREFIDKLD